MTYLVKMTWGRGGRFESVALKSDLDAARAFAVEWVGEKTALGGDVRRETARTGTTWRTWRETSESGTRRADVVALTVDGAAVVL